MLIEDAMNTQNLPRSEPRQTWRQMLDEGNALEIIELQDRIADVEGERDTYRELAQSALDVVRRLTRERDDLRQLIDHWTTQRRSTSRRPRRTAA